MHTWKLTIQDDCSDVDMDVPVVGNMEVYVKASTIDKAIMKCYEWYTIGTIFVIKAELV